MTTNLSAIRRYTMDDYLNWDSNIFVEKKIVECSCPIHWHDHYEIEYIASGKGKQILNGIEYPLSSGTLYFLTPTDFHELIVEEELTIIKFNFQEDDVDDFILSALIGIYGNTSMMVYGEEKNMFNAMFETSLKHTLLNKKSDYYSQMIKKLLECILLDMIEHLGKTDTSKGNTVTAATDNIRYVLSYIHKHFKKELSLKTVADIVHYSPQHLSKIFHRIMGITFKEYIINLRMNYASRLILNTQKSISDIGKETGFGTRQNFTKEFKRYYSCTPSEYRMKNKNLKKASVI